MTGNELDKSTFSSAVLFLFSFLFVGITGVEIVTRSFEPILSERLGTSAFLYVLCLFVSIVSMICYAVSSLKLRRLPKWFMGPLGGVIAAGAFCAPVIACYAGLGFGYSLALVFLLPISIGSLWPVLGAEEMVLPGPQDADS